MASGFDEVGRHIFDEGLGDAGHLGGTGTLIAGANLINDMPKRSVEEMFRSIRLQYADQQEQAPQLPQDRRIKLAATTTKQKTARGRSSTAQLLLRSGEAHR